MYRVVRCTPTPYQVDLLRYMQWKHIDNILEHPLEDSYQAKIITDFKWTEWINPKLVVPDPIKRSDIVYKNFPYRNRPIEPSQE